MPRYLVERDYGLVDEDEMQEIALLSKSSLEHFPDIVWEHSHVCVDDAGVITSFCVYDAPSEQRVREHAERLGRHAVRGIHEVIGDIDPRDLGV